MSTSFKVQKLSTVNNLAKTKIPNKTQQSISNTGLGQILFSIPSLSILTYSSHALIQILTCYFENDQGQSPYAQVQKALQILSQPITDDILKSDLNSLILKNIHRKKDLHVFFCLWAQYLPIQEIVQRINDKKLQEKVVYTILVTYLGDCTQSVLWYQNLALQNQVKDLLQIQLISKNPRVFEEIDAEITNLLVKNHNHFIKVLNKLIKFVKISSNLQIFNQVKKIPVNFLKNKNNQQFIDQMSQKLLLIDRSSKNTYKKQYLDFIEYINQNELKEIKEILEKFLITKLENKINSEKKQTFYDFVESIFQENNTNSIRKFLKLSVKNFFVSNSKQNLSRFFQDNFKLHNFLNSANELTQIQQKRVFMIKLMNQLSKENQKSQSQVHKIIYSKYLYNFLEGTGFNFTEQIKFLQRKKDLKFDHEREVISKCIKHIKNEKLLNLMTFNKSSFPESLQWPIDPSLNQISKKYESISLFKKVLGKVKQYWGKIEEEMLKENKKIDLIFSVLRIQIDKKPICLTIQQFAELLKSYSQGINIDIESLSTSHYRSQYNSVNSIQQQKMAKSIVIQKDQEIHPIILQARIIKLMKKQLKKASVQQISKAISFNSQKTHQIVKKLVTKGYLQEHHDETYSYEA